MACAELLSYCPEIRRITQYTATQKRNQHQSVTLSSIHSFHNRIKQARGLHKHHEASQRCSLGSCKHWLRCLYSKSNKKGHYPNVPECHNNYSPYHTEHTHTHSSAPCSAQCRSWEWRLWMENTIMSSQLHPPRLATLWCFVRSRQRSLRIEKRD